MDRQGNPVGMLSATDFIMNTSNVNAYEKTELTLYFADETGNRLVPEKREVVHNINTCLLYTSFDLFCAALTTLGELILPLMLRYITNQGMQDLASMTAGIVIRIGGLYLILRIIDSLAAYYMAYTAVSKN